jgi:hypothetical protein
MILLCRTCLVGALLCLVISPVAAMEGDPPGFPQVNWVEACLRVAQAFGGNVGATERVCTTNEGDAREAALYLWPSLPPDLQAHCVRVAERIDVHLRYQSLHNCLSELESYQRQYGGEIPASVRQKLTNSSRR